MSIAAALRAALTALKDLTVRDAYAHCDTEDGRPSPTAAARWRPATSTTRSSGSSPRTWTRCGSRSTRPSATALPEQRPRSFADRTFLETLVRVHRAGEGEGFDGIKPSGTALPPQVVAADAALAQGTTDPLVGEVYKGRWAELEERFHRAVALQDYDVDDLKAARAYVEAYVSYVKWAEGEDHGHGPGPGHGGHGHAGHGDAEHSFAHHHMARHSMATSITMETCSAATVLHGDVRHHGGSEHR